MALRLSQSNGGRTPWSSVQKNMITLLSNPELLQDLKQLITLEPKGQVKAQQESRHMRNMHQSQK